MGKFKNASLLNSKKITESVSILAFNYTTTVDFIPGQYFKFRLEKQDKTLVERDYSVLKIVGNKIYFCIEKLPNGELSPFLHNMKKGEKILLKGPLGRHFLIKDDEKNCFISSGTGITPFISYFYRFKKNKTKMLCSFKTEKDLLFKEEIISENSYITLTREINSTRYNDGRITKKMLNKFFKEELSSHKFFICGSTIFSESIKKYLLILGVSKKNIFTENFG